MHAAGYTALRQRPPEPYLLPRPAGARRLTTDLKSAFVEAIPEEMARAGLMVLLLPVAAAAAVRRYCRHGPPPSCITQLLPCAIRRQLCLYALLNRLQERLKMLKKQHGNAVLGQVTVEQVSGSRFRLGKLGGRAHCRLVLYTHLCILLSLSSLSLTCSHAGGGRHARHPGKVSTIPRRAAGCLLPPAAHCCGMDCRQCPTELHTRCAPHLLPAALSWTRPLPALPGGCRRCCGRRRCWTRRRASASGATPSQSCRQACAMRKPPIAANEPGRAGQGRDRCYRLLHARRLLSPPPLRAPASATRLEIGDQATSPNRIHGCCRPQERLPGAKPGGEPLPEGMLWLLLTGQVGVAGAAVGELPRVLVACWGHKAEAAVCRWLLTGRAMSACWACGTPRYALQLKPLLPLPVCVPRCPLRSRHRA